MSLCDVAVSAAMYYSTHYRLASIQHIPEFVVIVQMLSHVLPLGVLLLSSWATSHLALVLRAKAGSLPSLRIAVHPISSTIHKNLSTFLDPFL